MAGRNRGEGKNLSGTARARRRRVGLSAAAGAFVAGAAMATGSVTGAAPAEADILTDMLDPILQPLLTGMTDALGAVDPTAGADLTSFLDSVDPSLALPALDSAAAVSPGTEFDNMLNALFGADLFGTGAQPAAATTDTATSATNFDVPLTVNGGTEPAVDLSVNGGPSVPVLVDTGSTGLVLPIQDIGFKDLANLGFPVNIGISGYSGGVEYLYLTFDTTVSFDNASGAVVNTAATPVDVPILSWPTSFSSGIDSIQQFFAADQVSGILGIGANAGGPETVSPITALPGDLGQGATINVAGNDLILGPDPLTPVASTSGAPLTDLMVSINGATPVQVSGDVDSGGVYGTIPSNLVGGASSVPPGTVITVYNSSGTELYSYTTTAADAPTVVSSGSVMDTGYVPFSQAPISVDYSPSGTGTTIFNSVPLS